MISNPILGWIPNSSNVIVNEDTYSEKELVDFEKKYGHANTTGSCFAFYPKDKFNIGVFWMLTFHRLVLVDKVDSMALHKALCKIPEYRDLCTDDTPFLSEYSDEDNKE